MACHMPSKTFMTIDERHDHSFSIPNPKMSEQFGTPNACTTCHSKKSNSWAVAKMKSWPMQSPHNPFSNTLAIAKAKRPEALEVLLASLLKIETPPILKASYLMLLKQHKENDPRIPAAILQALSNENSLITYAAIAASEGRINAELRNAIYPFLRHSHRLLRTEAARVLALSSKKNEKESELLKTVTEEYLKRESLHLDQEDVHHNLGFFYESRQDEETAHVHYTQALKIDETFLPTLVNLVPLKLRRGEVQEARTLALALIRHHPSSAQGHFYLGAFFADEGDLSQASRSFKRAFELSATTRHLQAVVSTLLKLGKRKRALAFIERYLNENPKDSEIRKLKERIEQI